MDKTLARFYSMVADKSDKDACWIWKASIVAGDYGQFWMNGKTVAAHRASFMLHKGPITEGKIIRHTCDCPSCVNPAHLIEGTTFENSQDMIARGRVLRGEQNGASKLTEPQVRLIKSRLAKGEKERTLARKMGFSRNAVRNISKGITWRHVA